MIKKVVNCYYVHKSNLKELVRKFPQLENIEKLSIINHEIIKYDSKANTISFIESPDWNIANEPIVGDSFIVNLNTGECKKKKGRINNPQIYHHKWMFVADDYTGFDVKNAKERSEEWLKISNLNKSKIGNKNYWLEILKLNGLNE